jgi:hypothetical protein
MTKEGWRKAIAEQARSGQSIGVFCRERGLNPKTFSVTKSQMKKGALVQVSGSRTVELVLPSGVTIRVDVSDLTVVLEALS